MIEPEYYTLKQAAEISNYSEDTLKHFGANGKLPIYMLTRKYRITSSFIDAKGVITEGYIPSGRINRFAKVSCYSLQSLESGDSEATAYIDPEYFYDDMGKNLGGYRYQVHEATKVILGVDKFYLVSARINDCVLIIMPDDLKRLQESEPHAETVVENKADSQAGPIPASAKVILRVNDNDTNHSGLLKVPRGADAWFDAIDDMTRLFFNANSRMPDVHEAWLELWTNPPEKYGITQKGNSLKMLSEKKELTKQLFKARWNKYIAAK